LAAVDPCYCCTERALAVVDPLNRPYEIDLLKISRAKPNKSGGKVMLSNLTLMVAVPILIGLLNIFLPTVCANF
jgi:hypothetical protein